METPGIGNSTFNIKFDKNWFSNEVALYDLLTSPLTVKSEDIIVGRLYFIDTNTPNLFITRIHVNKKFRRKGYGKTLILGCEQIARINRCESISLYVSMDNPDAIEFYREFDYFISLVLKKKRYYMMTKRLYYGK